MNDNEEPASSKEQTSRPTSQSTRESCLLTIECSWSYSQPTRLRAPQRTR